jgi:ADP-heptose:LPS heptosyltransferase
LGDTVCAIPAFRLIRSHFPRADLTLLCDRPLDEQKVAAWQVIEPLGLFNRVISYRSGQGRQTLRELYAAVRSVRPAVLVNLPQMDRPASVMLLQRCFFYCCGVRRLIGFRPQNSLQEWYPNEPERLVRLLNDEGIPGSKPAYDIPISQPALASLCKKLRDLDIDLEQPYLVFCGGGKTATQRWPLPWYGRVLSAVNRRWKIPVIGVGSPAEIEAYRRDLLPVFPQLRMPPGGLSIGELVELLRFAQAYLGNDTGPMHLAAAVGCPVAAVISARNKPGSWDPDAGTRLIIRHRTACEGCRLSECVLEKHRCLTSIGPERVEEELNGFLDRLPARRLSQV